MQSYMYRDPADALDRKRGEEKARVKRRNERDAPLTEDELNQVPAEWLTELARRSRREQV